MEAACGIERPVRASKGADVLQVDGGDLHGRVPWSVGLS
jgi:hypothetical protein